MRKSVNKLQKCRKSSFWHGRVDFRNTAQEFRVVELKNWHEIRVIVEPPESPIHRKWASSTGNWNTGRFRGLRRIFFNRKVLFCQQQKSWPSVGCLPRIRSCAMIFTLDTGSGQKLRKSYLRATKCSDLKSCANCWQPGRFSTCYDIANGSYWNESGFKSTNLKIADSKILEKCIKFTKKRN